MMTDAQAQFDNTIENLVEKLDEIEARKYDEKFPGSTHPPDKVHTRPRRKYVAIDIGTSGAWLVERETGEIFNIKSYGSPDKNKKAKSDIGNIATVDPENMHNRRYNYLR